MTPDEQRAEKHAELIDVSSSGGQLAEQLFRRGILRREYDFVDLGVDRFGAFRLLRANQLGDAEIEQLHGAAARHEHVRWLQIAMDDQIAVRVRDSQNRVQKQANARIDIELMHVAVTIYAIAVNVFED